MKLPVKVLRLVVLVIVVLLLIASLAFYLFGERAIKMGIETAATKSLNVGVSIDDIDLSVFFAPRISQDSQACF